MFDSNLLRSFVMVAETASFTRAAELLHSTQTTVSAQIRRLEHDAGAALFSRTTRNVTLTSEGQTLLGFAQTILRLNQEARARLHGQHYDGTLRLGISEDLAPAWLPGILRAFRSRYPAGRLSIEIGISVALFRRVDEEQLDVAVGGRCRHREAGSPLWREPLVWAFAAQGETPEPLPVALFPEPCPYRESALLALAASRRKWDIVCTSPSLAGVLAAARSSIAVTPLPKSLITDELRILGVDDGLPPLGNVEYLVRFRERARTEPIKTMVKIIQSEVAHG